MSNVLVANFYKFVTLSDVEIDLVSDLLQNTADNSSLLGLVVIAPEGINATLSGDEVTVRKCCADLAKTAVGHIEPKESWATKRPFRIFKIDRRPEIVTLGGAITPDQLANETLLTPEQWHNELSQLDMSAENGPILLDLRNRYETRIGKFKGALDPDLGTFRNFERYVEENPEIKNRPIYMYCTGGIRCEKAAPWMKEKGFTNLKQLHGGILRYMEQYPEGHFDGECFVFDHRVAVDSKLEPTSKYKLCPVCGDPGDKPTQCIQCGKPTVVCSDCLHFCSKNCRYHYNLRQQRSSI